MTERHRGQNHERSRGPVEADYPTAGWAGGLSWAPSRRSCATRRCNWVAGRREGQPRVRFEAVRALLTKHFADGVRDARVGSVMTRFETRGLVLGPASPGRVSGAAPPASLAQPPAPRRESASRLAGQKRSHSMGTSNVVLLRPALQPRTHAVPAISSRRVRTLGAFSGVSRGRRRASATLMPTRRVMSPAGDVGSRGVPRGSLRGASGGGAWTARGRALVPPAASLPPVPRSFCDRLLTAPSLSAPAEQRRDVEREHAVRVPPQPQEVHPGDQDGVRGAQGERVIPRSASRAVVRALGRLVRIAARWESGKPCRWPSPSSQKPQERADLIAYLKQATA